MMNFNPRSCKMNERTLETNTPFRTRGPTPETANNRFTSQITAFSFASTGDRQDDQASSDGLVVAVSRFGYCPLALDGPVPGWRGPTRASRVVASLRGCDRHDNPVARPSPSRRPRGSGSRASRCVKCHHSGAPWPDAPPRPPRTQQTRAQRRRVAGGGDAMFGRYARARPLAGAQPHPPSRGCRDEPARRPSRTPEQYPLSARARFPNDG